MSTEQLLRDALEARAATASPDRGALAEIRRRADRRRWTARLQVATAAVAVAGIAAGAFALAEGPRTRPAPPAVSTSPDPSPASPEPGSPSPSPSATAAPVRGAAGPDEFVALLADGRLVVVSASTGRISRTVATVPVGESSYRVGVELAPDRGSVYVTRRASDGPCDDLLERYDLGTGDREDIGRGYGASVSPDGRSVAFLVECDGPAVLVRDVATGTTRRYAHSQAELDRDGNPQPWNLHQTVWHADGRRIWLVTEWENTTELRLLDPEGDRTTADAERVRTDHVSFHVDRRGEALVFLHTCCYPELTEESLIVLREPDGRERVLVRSPATGTLSGAVVGPDGDLLFARSGRLYRVDLEAATTVDLGRSTALARDW